MQTHSSDNPNATANPIDGQTFWKSCVKIDLRTFFNRRDSNNE